MVNSNNHDIDGRSANGGRPISNGVSVDKELDKLLAEMKVSLADDPQGHPVGEKRKQTPSPNRILYVAIMMVVIMVLCFIFFSYYLDRMSANMPPQVAGNSTAVTNPPEPPQPASRVNPSEAAAQPSGETTEYKSNAIKANFRRGARLVEPEKKPETEETTPHPEAPKGAGY